MIALGWIWLTVFARMWWYGSDYYGIRPRQAKDSAFVAGVVTRTCRAIRAEREAPCP